MALINSWIQNFQNSLPLHSFHQTSQNSNLDSNGKTKCLSPDGRSIICILQGQMFWDHPPSGHNNFFPFAKNTYFLTISTKKKSSFKVSDWFLEFSNLNRTWVDGASWFTSLNSVPFELKSFEIDNFFFCIPFSQYPNREQGQRICNWLSCK